MTTAPRGTGRGSGCYWPTMATDLEQPNYYVERTIFKNDRVFGTQFLLDLERACGHECHGG